MSKAKDYLLKAIAIKEATTKSYREWAEKVRAELEKTKYDPDLSASGREKRLKELRQTHGVELLQAAYRASDEYKTWINRAKKAAEDALYKGPHKPSREKIERFNKDFKRFKTELMLSANAESAEKKLHDFVSKIDDPYFANEVIEQFHDIASTILNVAGGEAQEYRVKLAQVYERLQNDHMSEEAKEAREILHSISNDSPKIFAPVVEENATSLLGDEFGQFVNDPERFFSQSEYSALKPQPYRDEMTEIEEKMKEMERINESMRKITQEKIASGELNINGRAENENN